MHARLSTYLDEMHDGCVASLIVNYIPLAVRIVIIIRFKRERTTISKKSYFDVIRTKTKKVANVCFDIC